MRYLIIAMVCSMLFACAHKKPEEKAFDAIKHFLKENLNDPNGYEPGEFSVIRRDETGWEIDHAFRARNGFNATMPAEWEFHVDKNYTVEKVKEWR